MNVSSKSECHFFAQSYVEYFFDIALRLDSKFATTNICCTLTLTGSSILYLLLILDFGFGLFFLQSDNFDFTMLEGGVTGTLLIP